MKIVGVDNYGRESVADILVAENVPMHFAKDILEFLNKDVSDNSAVWYRIVKDDYKLWRGMEELV